MGMSTDDGDPMPIKSASIGAAAEISRPDATNPSIFLRLNRDEPRTRELAWHQFYQRYGSIIASFARRFGVAPHDVEDIVQDVLIGFYATSPRFTYDPAKGRFRSYLKSCTCHLVQRHAARRSKHAAQSLASVDAEAIEVDQAWNDIWEQEQLRRAIELLRAEVGNTRTFQAFELYVIQDLPPAEVSERLSLHVDNVYRSKESVAKLLREKLAAIRAEDE